MAVIKRNYHVGGGGDTPSMSDDSPNIPALIAKVRENGDFKDNKLHYDRASFTNDDMVALADALRTNTRLSGVTLRRMEMITDKGATALAEGLEGNPRLEVLDLSNNSMTDASADAWAKTIGESKTLCHVNLAKNNMTDTGHDKILDAIVKGGNPNLFSLWTYKTNPPDVAEMLNINRKHAWEAAQMLVSSPEEMNAYFLREVDTRQPSVIEQAKSQTANRQIVAGARKFNHAYVDGLMDKLPKLPQSLDALFTPDERNYAPLDNPRLWPDAAAAKATLDKLEWNEALLEKQTLKGSTVLTAAAHIMGGAEFVRYVNEKGISLRSEHLLEEDNTPNALLSQLIGEHKALDLFTGSNWKGGSKQDLLGVHQALPEHLGSRVALSALIQDMRRSSPQNQGLGR